MKQSRQQTVERDLTAQAMDVSPLLASGVVQAAFERRAKGACAAVLPRHLQAA